MKSRPRLWAAGLVVAIGAGPWSGSLAGASPTPQRVVSLNLAADEILVEILPAERLVGVTAASDNPNSSNIVGRLPASTPRFFRGDMERLVALEPDLVIVSQYTDADFLRLLEASGLRYHRMVGLHSLAGFRKAILALGEAVGEPEAGARIVARYDERLSELAARLEGTAPPRVLYWSNPFTAGGATAIGAMIECGGARNVGRELGIEGVVPVGAERAFVADPDFILVGGTPGASEALRDHPLLSQLRAVKERRVVEMPMRLLFSLSHHAAEGCWALAEALHPERFPEPGS